MKTRIAVNFKSSYQVMFTKLMNVTYTVFFLYIFYYPKSRPKFLMFLSHLSSGFHRGWVTFFFCSTRFPWSGIYIQYLDISILIFQQIKLTNKQSSIIVICNTTIVIVTTMVSFWSGCFMINNIWLNLAKKKKLLNLRWIEFIN